MGKKTKRVLQSELRYRKEKKGEGEKKCNNFVRPAITIFARLH